MRETRAKTSRTDAQRSAGRRRLLVALGLGGTGMVASKWAKPVVDSVVVPLHAQGSALVVTVAGNTAGSVFTTTNNVGQSLTVPGSSSFNNLRFNWYGLADARPVAVGTLYLLTQELSVLSSASSASIQAEIST